MCARAFKFKTITFSYSEIVGTHDAHINNINSEIYIAERRVFRLSEIESGFCWLTANNQDNSLKNLRIRNSEPALVASRTWVFAIKNGNG